MTQPLCRIEPVMMYRVTVAGQSSLITHAQLRAQIGLDIADVDAFREVCLARVSVEWDVTRRAILGRSRMERVAMARFAAMYLIRRLTGDTLEDVGRIFKRDHGTVLHAEKRVQALMDTEPRFNAKIKLLLSQLQPAERVAA